MPAKEQSTGYSDIIASRERLSLHGAGYFKRCDGRIFLHSGPDALDLLHRITTNNLLSLKPGMAERTVLTSETGRVVDAMWVAMLESDELLLLSDSADYLQTQRGILKYTIIEEACLHDLMSSHARITLIGRFAAGILRDLGFSVNDDDVAGTVDVKDGWRDGAVALKSDALGINSWEVVAKNEVISEIAEKLEWRETPLLASELLQSIRIENRVPWPAFELNHKVNPLEAGLEEFVDFDKGCYVGQEVIARLDSYDKVQRKLVAVESELTKENLSESAEGVDLFAKSGERSVGWLTSAISDHSEQGLKGLAFVRNRYAVSGMRLFDGDGVEYTVKP